ncbi:MAG TPA: TlpA family protein disulfide reductase [Gammaproteobacteria bacterium]|nr:TlpA family protein disulfide reductase [Gammaproteobacteria bacterium]
MTQKTLPLRRGFLCLSKCNICDYSWVRKTMSLASIYRTIFLFCLILSGSGMALASEQRNLSTGNGDEFSFEVFSPARQHDNQQLQLRILWVAPSFGIDPRIRQTAQALSQQGVEVWLIDLADALFLPRSASTLRGIPSKTVAGIIDAISQQGADNTDLLVVSSSYGAIPALRGIRAWQQQQTRRAKLIGAVLFSPSFFTHVPELGVEPSFIAELAATNSPVYIFQSARNGNRWHLPAVLKALKNAPVYSEILRDVVSVFYTRDTAPATMKAFAEAPQMILRAARMLRRHPMPTTVLAVNDSSATTPGSGINTRLHPYRGSVVPSAIRSRDAKGKAFTIDNYKGYVTLINFWASWCPPCVKEIPSLNRLMDKMRGKPFRLISVNYAETPETIHAFLAKVNVDFPVLVDRDGRITRRWKVVAFPSTFVIGPDGRIHYGVNAGIHWDTEEVEQQLNLLLPTGQDNY